MIPKTKFNLDDVVYSKSVQELTELYPDYNWCGLDIDIYVVLCTFIDNYSKDKRCLLQWGENDKKTGLPKVTTDWERLLVKIGVL